MNRVKILLFAAIAFGVALPVIGLAASPSQLETVAIKVAYDDLKIDTTAGARVLYFRLKRAAEEACGIEAHVRYGSLKMTQQAKACYEEALAAAVETISSEELSRIHAG